MPFYSEGLQVLLSEGYQNTPDCLKEEPMFLNSLALKLREKHALLSMTGNWVICDGMTD